MVNNMGNEVSKKADKLVREIVETAYPWVQSTAEKDAVLEKVVNKLEDYIAKLEAENAKLKEERRWIPVSEGLPEEFESVLVLLKEGYMETDHIFVSEWSCYHDVTHWMPLPDLPEVTE